jgi:Ala-tRNA(Pro) deacylase
MSDILATLDELGIAAETHAHPPVLTVEEARAHWGAIDARHSKNLFLKDAGGAYWLVCMPADAPLDLKSLPARIGSKRLRFAPAEDLERLLGVQPGSVSAFAIVNDRGGAVRLVLDAALMDAPRIAFHPLDNSRTTVLTPADLRRFLASIGREALEAALGDRA